jgi:ribosomal-protein-alanine N-acetyltransferase
MNDASAREIADGWKYEPPYDFYDATADSEDYDEFVNPEKWPECFYKVCMAGQLVGFYLMTSSGDAMEIGLGMRPDLVGHGSGSGFVRACLDHARDERGFSGPVNLYVASFNERAIRTYERIGFKKVREYLQETNGSEFPFVAMRLDG